MNEGIRAILYRFIFFFTKRFQAHKKHKKSIKSTKSTKRQTSDFLPHGCFL